MQEVSSSPFDLLYNNIVEGFDPGCSTLHSMMTAHGPEGGVYKAVLLKPAIDI